MDATEEKRERGEEGRRNKLEVKMLEKREGGREERKRV